MKRLVSTVAVLASLAPAAPARAHHGVAAVGVAGPEGPGAALDTTSPLPLPQGTALAMVKSELVPFQQRAGFADQKDFSSFNMAAIGFGIRPWMSAYVFQPFNVKSQDGVGRNAAAGDPNLMLVFGFKYDDGLQLVPEKESLDDLMDWHFSLWVSSTLPLGPTARRAGGGDFLAPDMQTGYGAPSPAAGVAVMRQLSGGLTFLAEVNYQHFFTHRYADAGYSYRFGGETRLGGALVYRAYGSGSFRIDLSGELNGLHLQRDQTDEDTGTMRAMQASGGAILYGGVGARAIYGPLSVSLGIRRALLKELNEEADQQGSEGLEKFRAALGVSFSTRF